MESATQTREGRKGSGDKRLINRGLCYFLPPPTKESLGFPVRVELRGMSMFVRAAIFLTLGHYGWVLLNWRVH